MTNRSGAKEDYPFLQPQPGLQEEDANCELANFARQLPSSTADTASDDAASDEDAASDDAASDDAASDDAASNDAASDDAASDDAASNDAASNDAASNDAASDDDVATSDGAKILDVLVRRPRENLELLNLLERAEEVLKTVEADIFAGASTFR